MRVNKLMTVLFIILFLLNGCGKENALTSRNSEEINTSEEDIVWQNEQIYDFYSGIGGEWGGSIVENEHDVFYTTLEGIIHINKGDCRKTFILKWKEKQQRLAWLYLDEDDLYYTPNGKKVYVMNFNGRDKREILSVSMIEKKISKTKKEGYLRPFIYGMRVYNNKMFFLTEEGRFYFDVTNKQLNYIDIGNAREDCFYDNSLIYVNSQLSGIYRFDFTTKKSEIIRGKENKENKDRKQYQDVFVYRMNLYYIYDDKLYMYSKNTEDILLSELSSGQSYMQRVFCKDAIYYSYMEWIDEDKGQYDIHLCKYDNGKVVYNVILPDDCEQLYGVLQETLFYKKDTSEYCYKIFNIC